MNSKTTYTKNNISRTELDNGQISWGYYLLAGKDSTGKRQQVTKQGFRTKGEAQDAFRQKTSEFEANALVIKDTRTFGVFFEEWLQHHGAANWGKKTQKCNRQHAAYAIRKFGDVPIQKLTSQRIEQDLYALLAHGSKDGGPLSPKTIQEVASLVKQALAKAVKWKLIHTNPMDDVERPSVKNREVTAPEVDEFERYLMVIQNTRYYVFSVFSAAIGCRRGEALALQWADINIRSGVVRISKSLSEVDGELEVKPTKSNRTRNVRVSAATLELLVDHRGTIDREKAMFGTDYQDNGLVFPRPDGRYYMPDQVSGRIREFMHMAGVKGSLHSLRHMHASLLLSKAVPITVIRDRLGHASSQVTLNVYSHVLKNDDATALETWDTETAGIVKRTRSEKRNLGLSRSTTHKSA